MSTTINVFGLGKVGSVMAALYASKGYFVQGFDPAPKFFTDLIGKVSKPIEPGLAVLIDSGEGRVNVNPKTSKLNQANVSLVIVPTPTNSSGGYELSFLRSSLTTIMTHLLPGSDHTIVIKSTVLPGDVQRLSDELRQEFGFLPSVVYSPEFIALGDVVKNMTNPDLLLIGSSDADAADFIESLSMSILENKPKIWKLGIEEAELAKVALNSYITMKISFANLIGEAAARLGSKSPSRVLQAIGSDPRVGKAYLSPGMGFGGPCFPRDNRALAVSLSDLGLPVELPNSVDQVNRFVETNFTETILNALDAIGNSQARVLVIGLTYKTGTSETVESQPLKITQSLLKSGVAKIHVFDPNVKDSELKSLLPEATVHREKRELNNQAFDLIFVGLPILNTKELADISGDSKIINPWA